MGRLLRRKTSSARKRKKQYQGGESGASPQSTANDSLTSSAISDKKRLSEGSREEGRHARPQQRVSGSRNIGAIAKVGELGVVGKTVQFLREVRAELRKVAWPSRQQTIGSTLAAVILVMIISAFLGLADLCLSGLIQMVLR